MKGNVAGGIFILSFLIGWSCAWKPVAVDTSWKIVVDIGAFNSISEAAQAEHSIDWSGRDLAAMNACTESFAAQELRHYLCKITGVDSTDASAYQIKLTFPANATSAILIGNLSQADSNDRIGKIVQRKHLKQKLVQAESFAIIPEKDNIYIIGHDRVGSLYGIYEFLERLGIRWYEPGDNGEYVPHLDRVKIPGKMVVQNPDYFTRGFWAWENRGHRDFYMWMARNRMNFWTIAEPDRAFLKKLGIQLTVGGHLHFYRFLNPDDEYPYNHPKFSRDNDKPDDPYRADSDEYQGDTNHDGTLSYFEAHPEWYGLINGKRETFKREFGTNICTSNDDAVAELCRKLVAELATGEWRDADILNFWPIDVGKWCECEHCDSLHTPTDRLLLLIYQIDQALKAAQKSGQLERNIKVVFPVYNETLPPPTVALPDSFDYDTCIGTFFPIRRCYVHFLNDTTCTEYNTRIWSDFLGWTVQEPRYYCGQLFIGEYFNVSRIKSLPVLYPKIMAHDLPLYYQYGVRHGHYMHVYTGHLGMKRINNYLFAKLMWNTEMNVNTELMDYYQNFYGEAASAMNRLYQQLEFATSSVKQWRHTKHLVEQIKTNNDTLFTMDHLQLKEFHPAKNDGVDLEESVMALKLCRSIMDSVLAQDWPEYLKRRFLDDDQNLSYAENTVNFYYYFAQSILARRADNNVQSEKLYRETIPYAKGLKAETEILQTASAHANAKDGLEATGVEAVYDSLGKAWGIR